ncbi:DUF1656 domain-containing protein [Acidocella aminolytica]|jgi:hypothetical protein|uniref:DUF1656 domain-containing protein n=1 Tax=Acidocella aminolytica 101 = DSM 11237 TaxID=1120923 RepID=A0A0D6PJ52_9PROT|nr:DUF1656 domain-containing protein [Acidocella aminolytica]GAN81421.1 hypothetical protein Aam_092_042 [Acidocella aminolytica 101 = DSM 11237]GBQ40920.1 hypothetical protein AA11237_2538 [Acidocella aminolytica 101 = DSM 11237]SHF33179.1 Protein of unknown function [Acidocella aminolytica 101 = DSM 11237]
MIGEINIYGVLFPPLLIWVGLALLLSTLIRRGVAAAGLYRFIWHRPLFDLCLLVMLTGLISLTANRFF